MMDLAETLQQASREAAELQAHLESDEAKAAAGETDVTVVAASGVLLERFLDDIDEAVGQVFVAGLSFPDPELPDELDSLAERARRHGLPTALAHLIRLKAWIEAISAEKVQERRLELARGAWDETQKLLAWLRLFRTELGFLIVEANLASEGEGEAGAAVRKVPSRSLTMVPLGLELERSGMLIISGLDLESKMPVVLRDHLAELNRDDPLSGRVISRLFQDAVDLNQVMRGLIRLEDHPVVTRKTVMLFRPAFRATPKMLPRADDFEPPEFPALDPKRSRGQHMPGPFKAVIEAKGARIDWTAPWPIEAGDVVQLNASKLLIREGEPSLELDLVARLKENETLRVLSVTTEDDGIGFLADDPTLFRIAPEVLARGAIEASSELTGDDALAGAWLRTLAFLFGGATDEASQKLKSDLSGFEPQGIDALYRTVLARDLRGVGTAPEAVEEVVRDTLTLAVLPKSSAVPIDALERVLGRSASSADLHYLTEDDQLVYQAFWLALQANLLEELATEIRSVVKRRYIGKLHSSAAPSVCARALGTYLVNLLDGKVTDQGPPPKTIQFLQAHLDDLRSTKRRRRGRKKMPLPELLELFQLADTLAVLTGRDRRGDIVALLPIELMKLAMMSVKPLLRWRTRRPSAIKAMAAGDALLIIAAARLRRYFVL